jgi:CheY-like chemotaxis protein
VSSARVLIVEDNAITRKMARATLEVEGDRLLAAGDSAELLAAVREAVGA